MWDISVIIWIYFQKINMTSVFAHDFSLFNVKLTYFELSKFFINRFAFEERCHLLIRIVILVKFLFVFSYFFNKLQWFTNEIFRVFFKRTCFYHFYIRFIQKFVIRSDLNVSTKVTGNNQKFIFKGSKTKSNILSILVCHLFHFLLIFTGHNIFRTKTLVTIIIEEQKVSSIEGFFHGFIWPVTPIDPIVNITWSGSVFLSLNVIKISVLSLYWDTIIVQITIVPKTWAYKYFGIQFKSL